MEIMYVPSCRVMLLDCITNPLLSVSNAEEGLKIQEALHLPSDQNPYVTEALKEIAAGLTKRMHEDTRGYFQLAYSFPFLNGGVGGLSIDLFIVLHVSDDDVLILPKYANRKNWMVHVPSPELKPDYDVICNHLFELVLIHAGIIDENA